MSFQELIDKIAKKLNFKIESFHDSSSKPLVIFIDSNGDKLHVAFNKKLTQIHKVSNLYWFPAILKLMKAEDDKSEE